MARLLGWLLLATSTLLFADGGAVLLHKQSLPLVVTVFESPTPPRVGDIDLSVLVASSETLEPVLDADVRFEFLNSESRIEARATHSQGRNKLLYSASVHLNDPGEWRYSVSIGAGPGASTPVTVSGTVAVMAEQPKLAAYWSYLLLPFVCLAILALHQWLRLGSSLASAGESFLRH